MSRRPIRILRRSALVLAVLYSMLCGAVYAAQERLLLRPVPLRADFPYTFHAPHEDVTIPAPGASLHGAYFRAERPRGAVLYLHGAGGNLTEWGPVAPGFVRRGYDVLMIDYRGFGKSSGAVTQEGELHADARAAYQYLRRRFPAEQIVVYGRSLGSGLAVYLATKHKPRAIVLEAPYFSVEELARARVPFVPIGLFKYPLRTHRWIEDVRSPIYIVHGTADDVIPFPASRRMERLATAPVRVYPVKGAGHHDLGEFDAYYDAMREIFGRVRR